MSSIEPAAETNPPPRPHVEEIAFRDPSSVFAAFAADRFAVFLDSALADGTYGRYAFIAADPFAIIDGDGRGSDPFDELKHALARYPLEPIPELPPFQGGAAGYFGYELAHRLERLPRAAPRRVDLPELALGFFDVVAAFDLVERRAWIISSGYPESASAVRGLRARARAAELRARIAAFSAVPANGGRNCADWLAPRWQPDAARADYMAKIARVIDYIEAGDIFQANLSRELLAPRPADVHPYRLYERLRAISPAPFAAYLALGESAILCSSPERFLKLAEGRVETRPIKGTRPRGPTPEEDRLLAQTLLSSEKDRAENVMIVDLLRNDLAKVCTPHSVRVRELCVLERFATVHHLTSTIEGTLEADRGAADVLRACFPGGSITGCPKVRAMEIIAELETCARGPHFGAIGYLGFDGAMDTNIAIRTLVVDKTHMSMRVGGGIVADSDPATEFEETTVKARALLRAAGGESGEGMLA